MRAPATLAHAEAAGIFGTVLLLYWATLAPDVVGHDGGQFQFVPYILGLAHQTGYPLYTLMGKLWTFIPWSNIAYRMNLFSAVFGALTVALVYLTVRQLSGRRWAALIGALSLAVCPAMWKWSTIAGVRSMSAFFPALVIWLAVKWQHAHRQGETATSRRLFVATALGFGFGLAHHRTIVFLVPGLLILILATDFRLLLRWRLLTAAIAALLLPQLLYLYLPLRAKTGVPFAQFFVNTWEDFWNLVLGSSEAAALLYPPPEGWLSRLALSGNEVLTQLGVVGVALAVIGLFWWCKTNLSLGAALVIFILSLSGFNMAWNTIIGGLDPVFLVPTWPAFAIAVGMGAKVILGWLEAVFSGRIRRLVPLSLSLLLCLSFLVRAYDAHTTAMALAASPLDSYRQGLDGGYRGRRLGMTGLPYVEPNAILVGEWEQITVFWYLQRVERINPEVQTEYPLTRLRQVLAEAGGRPVYAAARTRALLGRRLTMVGSLVKVLEQPETEMPSADAIRQSFNFGDQIGLRAYRFWDDRGRPQLNPPPTGDVLGLSLYWQALRRPDADYSVSVRLLTEEGKKVAQSDLRHPVLGLSPTSTWQPGQWVADYYELPTRGLASGCYHLAVILYAAEPEGFRNLPVTNAQGVRRGNMAILEATLQR